MTCIRLQIDDGRPMRTSVRELGSPTYMCMRLSEKDLLPSVAGQSNVVGWSYTGFRIRAFGFLHLSSAHARCGKGELTTV